MDASNLLKPALQSGEPALHRLDHLQGIPQLLREGPRAGAPLPEDRRERADRSSDAARDPEGPEARTTRSTTSVSYTDDAIKRGGRAVGALHPRPQAARQGDRRDRRGRRARRCCARRRASAQDHDRRAGHRGDRRQDRAHPAEERVEGRHRAAAQPRAATSRRVVFGQDEAIDQLSRVDQAGPRRPASPEKPIGSYLLAGPTGVGKTEVARQLARLLGLELHALRHVGVHGAPHASRA